MTYEATLQRAQQDQRDLDAKRDQICARLSKLHDELAELAATSEYARDALGHGISASFNLSEKHWAPAETIPLVERASWDELIEWEENAAHLEHQYREHCIRPRE